MIRYWLKTVKNKKTPLTKPGLLNADQRARLVALARRTFQGFDTTTSQGRRQFMDAYVRDAVHIVYDRFKVRPAGGGEYGLFELFGRGTTSRLIMLGTQTACQARLDAIVRTAATKEHNNAENKLRTFFNDTARGFNNEIIGKSQHIAKAVATTAQDALSKIRSGMPTQIRTPGGLVMVRIAPTDRMRMPGTTPDYYVWRGSNASGKPMRKMKLTEIENWVNSVFPKSAHAKAAPQAAARALANLNPKQKEFLRFLEARGGKVGFIDIPGFQRRPKEASPSPDAFFNYPITPSGAAMINPLILMGLVNTSVGSYAGPRGYVVRLLPIGKEVLALMASGKSIHPLLTDKNPYKHAKGLSDQPKPTRTDIHIGDWIIAPDTKFNGRVIGVGGIKYGKKWITGYRVRNQAGRVDFIDESDAKKIRAPQ